jgi:hypothetical protein
MNIDDALDDIRARAHELAGLTAHWTVSPLTVSYDVDQTGWEDYEDDLTIVSEHDYVLSDWSVRGGHAHLGRILLTLGLCTRGGWPGIWSAARFTATFTSTTSTSGETEADGTEEFPPPHEQPGALRDSVQVARSGELRARLLTLLATLWYFPGFLIAGLGTWLLVEGDQPSPAQRQEGSLVTQVWVVIWLGLIVLEIVAQARQAS